MAGRVTIEQLNQKVEDLISSIAEFKQRYNNDQQDYKKGAEKHREEHEGIDRILRGRNGNTPGLIDEVRTCKQFILDEKDIRKTNKLTVHQKIGLGLILFFNAAALVISLIKL